MSHILLVDDDQELTELLTEYLASQGFRVDTADNGRVALEKLELGTYDLMVLDIMMPELDGLSVLKQLSVSALLPIIMLTAKGDEIDRIVGLELGADDYLSKPCNPRELVARINAVIKRYQQPYQSTYHEVLPDSLFQIDMRQRQCYVDGNPITLTATELDLLYQLIKHKGTIVDKYKLSKLVLQRQLEPFDRSIDVHISRLRKKLSPYHPEAIKSIRGKGYQLTI